MSNKNQSKMFTFAHFSYDNGRIILRATRRDNTEGFYVWETDKYKTLQHFSDDTHVLIDASIPEEMRRYCEER